MTIHYLRSSSCQLQPDLLSLSSHFSTPRIHFVLNRSCCFCQECVRTPRRSWVSLSPHCLPLLGFFFLSFFVQITSPCPNSLLQFVCTVPVPLALVGRLCRVQNSQDEGNESLQGCLYIGLCTVGAVKPLITVVT